MENHPYVKKYAKKTQKNRAIDYDSEVETTTFFYLTQTSPTRKQFLCPGFDPNFSY